MRIVVDRVTRDELRKMAEDMFGDMVKAVVDVRRGLLAVQAELHSDLEALLLQDGSIQGDLWGINIYPDEEWAHLIEFDSLINVRPSQGNRTRGVDSEATRERISDLIRRLVVT